ncbi:unnamed protein product [Mytilus edulis]|uniref:Uncharacterized protein n=1 Tax=Mytilus edulis TaxID=6550 RepID=A0A8S3U6Z3_MYTED|nr:unnamed protein product [Mytilus edulis]
MARHYKKYAKRNKHKRRLKNKAAMQQSKLKFMLSQARKQVVNLSHRKLTDDEYLVLSRGLKFIPSPSVKRAKQDLLHDFDELARKMRCRYLYHGNLDEIHPFRVKSGHTPPLSCNTLENYLFNTKHELSSMQIRKFRNNLSLSQRSGISSLLNDESLIIKKADKSNNVVILDKVNYLLEGDRQLNTQHYTKLENFDLKALRCNINTYVKGMYTKGVIDYSTFNYLNNGNQIDYGPGYMHILPKIHRLNESELVKINKYGFNIDNIMPPCRPIISQIGTVTEFIGRYIDFF